MSKIHNIYKLGPSIKLITIPCLLASIGIGVLKPFSWSFYMKEYSLAAASLDKYNQLKFFLFCK